MKKVLCNFILFVSFAFLVTPKSASAYIVYKNGEPEDPECTKAINALHEEALISKYGLSLEQKDSGFEIILDGKDMSSTLTASLKKKIKFRVDKIEGFRGRSNVNSLEVSDYDVIKSDYISSSNKELTIKNNTITLNRESNLGYKIHLKAIGFEDPDLASACGKDATEFEVIFNIEVSGVVPLQPDVSDEPVESPVDIVSSKKILDCTGYKSWSKNGFNYKYCDALSKAKEVNSNEKRTLKCDATKFNTPSSTSTDYYLNKKYFTATFFKEANDGKHLIYDMGYTCGTDETNRYDAGKCKIKCREVVTVEYGPPVASKAGLCFEYKVKVTSRVSCGVSGYPSRPPEVGSLCTPDPICTVPGSGIIHHQGGPSDDFDECVVACDGGKYSDYCSNRCYEKVYGEKAIKKTSGSEVSFADRLNTNSVNTKVEKVDDSSSSHKYYCDGDNIKWRSGHNGGDRSTSGVDDSRWHNIYAWGIPPMEDYKCYSSTGIPRRCGCGETCTWRLGSCSSVHGSYINPGEAITAHNANVKKYNEQVSKCNAAAECSDIESNYTIEVKFNGSYKVKEQNPLVFPVDENGTSTYDILKHGIAGTSTYANTTLLTSKVPNGKTIDQTDNPAGCYTTSTGGSLDDIWYQAAWSFPGSWINNKTGEVSYLHKNRSSGWQEVNDKFCLPLDVPDVNERWWSYYYTLQFKDDSNISYADGKLSPNCEKECTFEKVTKLTADEKKAIIPNIIAHVTGFGSYGWNFDIECFYATAKDIPIPGSGSHCDLKCTKTTGYRVRSVDLGNLFPDVDGGSGSVQDPNKVGRKPGFNWSSSAKSTVKNETFKSNPSEYTKKVQKMADTVYDKENELDYHLVLTRGIISKLRENKTFDDFKGDTKVQNGVPHYFSRVIRDNFNVTEGVDIPSDGAIACNNIKGMKTCDEVNG